MKFPLDLGLLTRSPAAGAAAGRCTRIIGVLGALALAVGLQGCSVMKIAYNQAAELAYWHLDGHFDFTDAQTLQVKADLNKLQAWHRQTQLPAYIETLQKLRQQIPADMDAAAACALYADVRGKLIAVSNRAEPAVVALVGTLNADQLVKLEARFAKGNTEYREDFLDGSPKARRDKRYKQAVSRAEMLYGNLEHKQLAVIGHRIDNSHFSAAVSYEEKVRRQQDALQTMRPLVAGQSTPEKTQVAMKGLFERTLNSPDPAYRVYMDKLTQDACAGFAELHNSTTHAQRSKAVETLLKYEQDFRTLHLQKS
ncbi:DUF6279 family lipoprotein [Polaromonas sp. YR568]|uniref:DUF6279 family lipoprotein n=1 Tax=Polaromonas sp. YR568 TaxID=1855301 RepID=UPI0020C8C092|nr:DUF6279 family lipoprotein [Polaromonas sp. YR568]